MTLGKDEYIHIHTKQNNDKKAIKADIVQEPASMEHVWNGKLERDAGRQNGKIPLKIYGRRLAKSGAINTKPRTGSVKERKSFSSSPHPQYSYTHTYISHTIIHYSSMS
jgi:hypothetical protein